MSHAQYLRDLLRPLGVYNLEAPFNGGELDVQGAALDGAMDWLEEVQRESSLATAEDWGLENTAQLFVRRPVADQPKKLAAALAALLRIGGDSFTLAAITGEPQGFQSLKEIIEDILPAHLGIEYDFWFLTWQELEDNFPSWQSIEDLELSWTRLETFVEFL